MPTLRISVNNSMADAALRLADPEFRAAYLKAILQEMSNEAPGAVSSWIAKNQPFNSRTGWAVSKWKGEFVGDKSIKITSLVPYVYWLNYGVRPHQMVYLLNSPFRTYFAFGHPYQARAPIPIVKGWTKAHGKGVAGMTMFRRPTEKSMAEGKWRHPGYAGKHFLEKALVDYMQLLNKRHPELIFEFTMT